MVQKGKITATKARYIKLGGKGQWEDLCFGDGTVRLGYYEVPHQMGLARDAEGIKAVYLPKVKDAGAAGRHADQVLAFYDRAPEVLWITFAHGRLWWCFAEPEVEFIGGSPETDGATGSRLRRAKDGWHDKTLAGDLLFMAELNGNLTKTAGYRGAICEIKPGMVEYLVRRINGDEMPEVVEARAARREALHAMEKLIKRLHPHDFELFVDLAFANSGWQRVGTLGGTQKTVDIEMVLPIPGLRAFVQVKSETNQRQLDDYVDKLAQRGDDFMFYAYHTSRTPLRCEDERVKMLDALALAEMSLKAGLMDWLVQRAG